MKEGARTSNASVRERSRKILLLCAFASSLVYIATDIIAAALYPGFSFTDQAVSELFAIGAPTSAFVVPLFTFSSLLLLGFAWGIGLSSSGNLALRWTALMFAASAIDALVLWNAFPMHPRGAERTFTDTMHLVLGANPFVWLTIVFGAAAFGKPFRIYSIATFFLLLMPAVFAFRYAPALDQGQATPGLGLAERISQYGYQIWQALFAGLLLRSGEAKRRGVGTHGSRL